MSKLLRILAFLLPILVKAQTNTPDCYVLKSDATGFERTYEPKLEPIACQIANILDKPNDFKVFDYGLYLHLTAITGAVDDVLTKIIEQSKTNSPFYMVITKVPSYDKVIERFDVKLKLPNSGDFTCFTDSKVKLIEQRISEKINGYHKFNSSTDFGNAIEKGLLELRQIVTEAKPPISNCCPVSASDILTILENKGFIGMPCKILGAVSAKPTNSGNRSSNYIDDYAKLNFSIDGEDVKLQDYLNLSTTDNAKVFITKNENFCDENPIIFDKVEVEFTSAATEFGTWYHIWKNPITNDLDILFIKQKIKSINHSEVNLPNIQNGNQVSAFEYTIHQRAFAPWDRFGHFPFPPPFPCDINTSLLVGHYYKNSFWGDKRAFSLASSIRNLDQRDANNVTARLHQYAKIKIGQNIIKSDGFCSQTRGYKNFIRTKYVRQSNPYTSPGISVVIPMPADEQTQLQLPTHVEKLGKNNKTNSYLYTQIHGTDPLVSVAPTIDCQLHTYIDEISENNKKFLHVRGVILYKGFPSYENFIEDKSGKKVFIYTFSPSSEKKLDWELLCPIYDYIKRFDMKIKIDNQGNFLDDELVIGKDTKHYNSMFYVQTNDPLSDPDLKNPNFTFSTTTITNWNNENISKKPAGDCPYQPCEGEYPNK
jgi:hypothetical protein